MTEKGFCCYCTHIMYKYIDSLTQHHFVSDAPSLSFPKNISGLVLCPVKCVPLSFLWHTYELHIVYVFVFVFVFCIQYKSFFSLTWCIFSRRIIPPLAPRTHTTLNFPPRPRPPILGRPHFLYLVLSLMEQQAVPSVPIKAPPFLLNQDKTPKCA